MKNLILTLALLISVSIFGQSEKEVHFNDFNNSYLVQTDCDNWHHVTKDGTLNGKFKHKFGNVLITGSMRNGKRHGTLVEYIDGSRNRIVEYKNGIAVQHTLILK